MQVIQQMPLRSMVILRSSWVGLGDARGNHPPHLPPLMVTENRIWLHITEVYIQGVNLVNTEACIFPYNVEC